MTASISIVPFGKLPVDFLPEKPLLSIGTDGEAVILAAVGPLEASLAVVRRSDEDVDCDVFRIRPPDGIRERSHEIGRRAFFTGVAVLPGGLVALGDSVGLLRVYSCRASGDCVHVQLLVEGKIGSVTFSRRAGEEGNVWLSCVGKRGNVLWQFSFVELCGCLGAGRPCVGRRWQLRGLGFEWVFGDMWVVESPLNPGDVVPEGCGARVSAGEDPGGARVDEETDERSVRVEVGSTGLGVLGVGMEEGIEDVVTGSFLVDVDAPTALTDEAALLVRGAMQAFSSVLFSGGGGGAEERDARLEAEKRCRREPSRWLEPQALWTEKGRRVAAHATAIDPLGRSALIPDRAGRVLLVDAASRLLWVWKGRRDAQVAWVAAPSLPATMGALLLAPRRGVLELWPAHPKGFQIAHQRLAAVALPASASLLYCSWIHPDGQPYVLLPHRNPDGTTNLCLMQVKVE